ncbi:MAG: hypothetical protein AMJ79_00605 [Phycisphaerae bacterium SM23_30]|nr:MAG: hypothetical protein AMJ79_00605 [Phycisphaerae bacterium SM23_30]
MDVSDLDYELPQELIAQQALPMRSQSRLLILHRKDGQIEHRRFMDVIDFLQPGNCLVVNDSKVIPARFFTRRATGGKIEGLFLRLTKNGAWQVLLKNASRLCVKETIFLYPPNQSDQKKPTIAMTVLEREGRGVWQLQVESKQSPLDILQHHGVTPLPPYIHRHSTLVNEDIDRQRYQTVYAEAPGSVAAPTAGLHFDENLLERIQTKEVSIARLCLHIGLGTFEPIATDKVEEHPMHAEQYLLDQTNADMINHNIQNRGRIVAVGTTSVRTLETLAEDKRVRAGGGWTNLLITPGHKFKVVDALITNFHLPRTTLLALVCAFGGAEQVLAAYREAIGQQYRFYSYGDAMLII